jgi:putative peptide zinc metalloprotease protein
MTRPTPSGAPARRAATGLRLLVALAALALALAVGSPALASRTVTAPHAPTAGIHARPGLPSAGGGPASASVTPPPGDRGVVVVYAPEPGLDAALLTTVLLTGGGTFVVTLLLLRARRGLRTRRARRAAARGELVHVVDATRTTSLEGDGAPRLADGVELVGEYQGSGYVEPRYLARRPDGQVVQLSRLLYLLVGEMDGHRDGPALAERVSARLGKRVSPDQIAFLVDQRLRPTGLLASREPGLPARPAQPVLALMTRAALVPQRIVEPLARALSPLFRTPLVIGVIAGLLTVDLWISYGVGVADGVQQTVREPATMALVFVLIVLSGAFHELGHAAACHYGGARPGAVGAGLYIMWPVFYSDITDAYRLSRRGRLRTDLGGLYFNAIVVLGVGAAYGLSGFGPLVVFIALQQLQMLTQFMPWVRLDGYYVVSDLAGVPDLFSRIGPALLGLVPGRAPHPRLSELTTRARWIVRGWVFTAVPVLLGALALLALAGPGLARTAWESGGLRYGTAASDFGSGDLLGGLRASVELMFLALPFVGMLITLVILARTLLRANAGRRDRRRAAPTASPAASAPHGGTLASGAAGRG